MYTYIYIYILSLTVGVDCAIAETKDTQRAAELLFSFLAAPLSFLIFNAAVAWRLIQHMEPGGRLAMEAQ